MTVKEYLQWVSEAFSGDSEVRYMGYVQTLGGFLRCFRKFQRIFRTIFFVVYLFVARSG